MKNHGYYMEHNYGHGQKHLAYNFYLLTSSAFFFHQIFELTDAQYKACREKLRAWIDIIIFANLLAANRHVLQKNRFYTSFCRCENIRRELLSRVSVH